MQSVPEAGMVLVKPLRFNNSCCEKRRAVKRIVGWWKTHQPT
jgi:hypothetical protein